MAMEAPKAPPATGSLHINHPLPPQPSPFWKMILVAAIAVGIQFGWALQLSLLTPYVQQLGVSHQWASFIWLCGPISGLLVQPTVGYYSDRCTSRFGRRRPFIAGGTALVALAFFFIGFSADIGHLAGDILNTTPKPRAIIVYVVGFWILDVANNMLQGPCRALLADLSAQDQSKTRASFAAFSFFMAVGSVLGFATSSYGTLYRLFPFTRTPACDVNCANVKSYVFISITLLLSIAALALFCVEEKPFHNNNSKMEADGDGGCARMPFLGEMVGALKDLKRPMWILMMVTALNWVAWFPYFLFNTDWMGKEVFGAKDVSDPAYAIGVRTGALGLMVNSVVQGAMSLAVEPLARFVRGVKRLWGIVNLVLAICFAMMVVVSKMAAESRHHALLAGSTTVPPPPGDVKATALAMYALLGIPLAITYSVPFALASIFSASSGAGQGLSLGVLNLAIVVPQMFVSTTSGPWDKMFGGGNLPAFIVAAVAAAASSLLAFTVLPSPPPDVKITGIAAGGH